MGKVRMPEHAVERVDRLNEGRRRTAEDRPRNRQNTCLGRTLSLDTQRSLYHPPPGLLF